MDGFPKFPNEIIAEIFLLCLPNINYFRPDPRIAPVLLTHVCSSWRAFASDLPTLWNSFDITDSWNGKLPSEVNSLKQLLPKLLDQATLWNHNSHGHLSSIFLALYVPSFILISRNQENFDLIAALWDPLLQCVLRNSQSFRKLFFKLDVEFGGRPFHHLPGVQVPNLESLHVEVCSPTAVYLNPPGDAGEDYDGQLTLFSEAPSLRRVIVEVPRYAYRCLRLPWVQLTHLIFSPAVPVTFFHFIVQNCLMLETLSMKIHEDFSTDITARPFKKTITMDYLCDLSITTRLFDAEPNIQGLHFITAINFPVIQKFRLCHSTNDVPEQLNAWEPLSAAHTHLINQLGNLRSLILGYQKISGDTLFGILTLLPYLMELVVDCALQNYRQFLERLIYQSGEGKQNIIPYLETFDLYVEIGEAPEFLDTLAPTLNAFLAMLLSRSGPFHGTKACSSTTCPARLKKVLLCVEDIGEEYQKNDIDNLRAQSQTHPQLIPPHMQLRIICDSDKDGWLQEEIETW